MLKKFLINFLYSLIQLIETFEYKFKKHNQKILNTIPLQNYFVETDTNFQQIEQIHITKPFQVYKIELDNGLSLKAADEHIVFDQHFSEVFIKDLKIGDYIQTKTGINKIINIEKYKYKISMFDISLNDNNHCYYSNDILSHNTIMSAIYLAHYIIFNKDRNAFLIANIQKTSKEIMDKVKVILEHLPFFMKPGVLKNDVFEMKFDNGCRIITGATTKRSGISFTIHLLYLDEFAHVADNIQQEFYSNIYPTISSSKISRIIITSTPNGHNLFYDLYTGAENGTNEYQHYRIDWWDVPGRDEKWYKETLANLGGSEEEFNKQYGNLFITADSRLLSSNHIKRLQEEKKKYVTIDFEQLIDLDLNYEKYLKFREDYDIDRINDKNNFFLFSIDLAEGGGGSSDFSIINIFEIDVVDEKYFDLISNPTSFQDFFGLKQIAIFRSNELSLDDVAKIAYVLMFDIFYSENIKVILEINTYGDSFLKSLQTVFPGKNDFDDEIIVKFKHKADSRVSKMGLKVKPDNKPIMAQNFKKYFHIGRVELTEHETVEEAVSFGKDKKGRYKGLGKHDDIMMTCINATEFFSTMDYADFIDEKFDFIDENLRKKIDEILEREESEGEGLMYDIYDLLNGNNYSITTSKE